MRAGGRSKKAGERENKGGNKIRCKINLFILLILCWHTIFKLFNIKYENRRRFNFSLKWSIYSKFIVYKHILNVI